MSASSRVPFASVCRGVPEARLTPPEPRAPCILASFGPPFTQLLPDDHHAVALPAGAVDPVGQGPPAPGHLSLPGLAPHLRMAASHLTTRLTETFTLPVDADLISDARKLIGGLD